jgi:hypothetical protein
MEREHWTLRTRASPWTVNLQTFCAGGWAMVVREREDVEVDRVVYVEGREGAKSAVETVGETRATSGNGLLDKHRQRRACDGSHGLKLVEGYRLVAQQRHAPLSLRPSESAGPRPQKASLDLLERCRYAGYIRCIGCHATLQCFGLAQSRVPNVLVDFCCAPRCKGSIAAVAVSQHILKPRPEGARKPRRVCKSDGFR